MTAIPTFDEIKETFELIDDWEERYRYLIELGRALPPLDEALKTPGAKVDGCASQVWLVTDGSPASFRFNGDSDAFIVRGLIALLKARLDGLPATEVAAADPLADFAAIGLDGALSPQRSNGLRAMVERLRQRASDAAS